MASPSVTSCSEKKLRVLLIPFFATSHIEPFTDLAIRLAATTTAVEATVAVTPANVSVVQSLLERRGLLGGAAVKVATYPFPAVDGLPAGVENLGKAAEDDSWRIDVAAVSDALMRPVQEALVRAQSPDTIITDMHFPWNALVADELGVPCITFSVIGAFPMLAMRHLVGVDHDGDEDDVAHMVTVPPFPGPRIRIPKTELPEFLRSKDDLSSSDVDAFYSVQAQSFGFAMNTSPDFEPEHYCEMYTRLGYVKRAYFLGPLALALPSSPAGAAAGDHCIDWLDRKPDRSVVYVSV